MVNHPNRGWRSRWTVDLESSTATHSDGWKFKFSADEEGPLILEGECIFQPSSVTEDDMDVIARIATEAGEIYTEALNARH